jgi:hypothetical protein
MLKHIEAKFNAIVIGILLLMFLGHIYSLGDIILDPGDGLKHFQIAQYSWKYPALLLDHWGKPIFTLLSSPFAQLGFQGMLIFNVILFLLTSIPLLKIAKLLNLEYGWIALVFCFASPIYFMMILSGLTEILFALAIICSLYFFLKKKFIAGTIILSFSFFIRPESVAIVPWFMIYMLINRQYIPIPFILTASVIYSLIGYFHFNDILWVINHKPYSNTGTYGSGSLFNFILNYKTIMGSLGYILLIGGSIIILIRLLKCKLDSLSVYTKWTLLIIMPIISVYAVHSILWWKGLQGSAGLLRVMATIIPLYALIALFALNELLKYSVKFFPVVTPKNTFLGLAILSLVLVIKQTRKIDINQNMVVSQMLLMDVANWYTNYATERRIYYIPPYFAFKANIDPYSEKGNIESMRKFNNKEKPSEDMKKGELLLWETQFSIKEGKLMLEKLMKDKDLILIRSFYPKNEITFWGEKYEAHVFEKLE